MTDAVPLTRPSDNPRKIPSVENVSQMINQYGSENLLKQLQDLYNKYKFMESQLSRSKAILTNKLPDITNSLQMVQHLQENQKEMTVDFQLSDNIYSKALIQPAESVALWLGANVMLEYPLDEARDMLEKNLNNANTTLYSTGEDLKFLKEQITTCEVNIARVYNNVVMSRPQRTA